MTSKSQLQAEENKNMRKIKRYDFYNLYF